MKTLFTLLTLLLFSLCGSAQKWLSVSSSEMVVKDTITNERDTMIKYRFSDTYEWSWHIKPDTLEGTLDAIVEILGCNYDYDTIAPPDSLFVSLSSDMTDSLTSTDPVSFHDTDGSPYMWYALKITQNSVTKWDITTWLNRRKLSVVQVR